MGENDAGVASPHKQRRVHASGRRIVHATDANQLFSGSDAGQPRLLVILEVDVDAVWSGTGDHHGLPELCGGR